MKAQRKLRVSWIGGFTLVVSACGPDLQHVQGRNGTPCEVSLGNEKTFMGEEICFRALNRKANTFSGYWVTGPEYSVFYKDREAITLDFNTNATWLELSEKTYVEAKPFMDWKGHVAEVTFVGIESDRPGYYGHMGAFKRGILVDHFVKLKEIPRPQTSSP
jgi:hypothetical protein